MNGKEWEFEICLEKENEEILCKTRTSYTELSNNLFQDIEKKNHKLLPKGLP